MTNFLESLPDNLVRVHKSWAVSLNHIKYIEGNIVRAGKFEVPLGQKYKDDFLKSIGDNDFKR